MSERLLRGASLKLSLPADGMIIETSGADLEKEKLVTPCARQVEDDFDNLLHESARKPQLALRLPEEEVVYHGSWSPPPLANASPATGEASPLTPVPCVRQVDADFAQLLQESSRKPQLPLQLPMSPQEVCIHHPSWGGPHTLPSRLQSGCCNVPDCPKNPEPSLAEVEEAFHQLMEGKGREGTSHITSPRLASIRPRELELPEQFTKLEDGLKYTKVWESPRSLEPSPDEVDAQLSRLLDRPPPPALTVKSPGARWQESRWEEEGRSLQEEEEEEAGYPEPPSPEALLTLSACQLEDQFDNLLNSNKPQLPLQVPESIPSQGIAEDSESVGAAMADDELLLPKTFFAVEPSQVDRDFERLLKGKQAAQQGAEETSALCIQNLVLAASHESQAYGQPDMLFETPDQSTVDADFERLMSQERKDQEDSSSRALARWKKTRPVLKMIGVSAPRVQAPQDPLGEDPLGPDPLLVKAQVEADLDQVDRDFERLLLRGSSMGSQGGGPGAPEDGGLNMDVGLDEASEDEDEPVMLLEEPSIAQVDAMFDELLKGQRTGWVPSKPATRLSIPLAAVGSQCGDPNGLDQYQGQADAMGSGPGRMELSASEVDADFDRILRGVNSDPGISGASGVLSPASPSASKWQKAAKSVLLTLPMHVEEAAEGEGGEEPEVEVMELQMSSEQVEQDFDRLLRLQALEAAAAAQGSSPSSSSASQPPPKPTLRIPTHALQAVCAFKANIGMRSSPNPSASSSGSPASGSLRLVPPPPQGMKTLKLHALETPTQPPEQDLPKLLDNTADQVDQDFHTLLSGQQLPSRGEQAPTQVSPTVEVECPAWSEGSDSKSLADPVLLEQPGLDDVQADFARLLNEEGGQPAFKPTLQLFSPRWESGEEGVVGVADSGESRQEEPSLREVDAEFHRLLATQTGSKCDVGQTPPGASEIETEPQHEGESSSSASHHHQHNHQSPPACSSEADTRPRKSMSEMDDTCPEWRQKKKHLFVLSNAGKPIFSRYGDENALAGFTAVIQAMMSFVHQGGDELTSATAGDHQVVFLERGPLYFVAVAATGEPVSWLACQLDLFYRQLLSILTSAMERAFLRSPKFDMRQLLGGTDPVLRALIRGFTHDPGFLFKALRPLPLPPAIRKPATIALQNLPSLMLPATSLHLALLLSGPQVVAAVSSKAAPVEVQDVLLLSNFIRSSESFRLSESFSPICLPQYNPDAFLYGYVCFLGEDVCLVLVSSCSESFFPLQAARQHIEATLAPAQVIHKLQEGLSRPFLELSNIPVQAGGGEIGATPLLHFHYLNTALDQVVSSVFRPPLNIKASQKRVIREYQVVYSRMHEGSKAEQQRLHFRACDSYVMLACIGAEFELYATFDALTEKSSAVSICNRLCAWIGQMNTHLFMTPSPAFFFEQ